jgi:histone-lysine N-methyltransferase SETD2
MADDTRDTKPESVDAALGEMKLEETVHPVSGESTIAVNGKYEDTPSPTDMKNSRSATPVARKSSSQSPLKGQSASQTPKSEYDEDEDEDGETIGGDITLTVEPGKAPKLSRKSIKKIPARQAPLFTELPDSTAESLSVFQVIPECLYGSKSMGRSKMSDEDDEPIECDCTELRSKCFMLGSHYLTDIS